MLLEQQVRQEADTVDMSYVGGISKARQFLRIARKVKVKAKRIGALCFHFAHRGEWDKANRFRKTYDRLCDLHDEVRERAKVAIRQPSALRFDTSPTPQRHSFEAKS